MNPALILTSLAKVPIWAWALAAVLAWGGWQRHKALEARDDFEAAKVQAQADHALQQAADAAETQRRTHTIMEAADAATIQSTADRADADRARAALDRVRAQLAAGQANRRAAGAAPAASGPAAGAPDVVPAELLSRCGARVLDLAAYADAAGTAGQACERAYSSLRPAP